MVDLEFVVEHNFLQQYNWIWGGRWYHYDTMHFEYRPEIVAAVKLKSKKE